MEQIQQRVIKTATWTRICHTRSWELSLKTRSICWGNIKKIETLFSVVHLWKDKKMSTNWNTENCLSTIVLLFCFTLKVVKNKKKEQITQRFAVSILGDTHTRLGMVLSTLLSLTLPGPGGCTGRLQGHLPISSTLWSCDTMASSVCCWPYIQTSKQHPRQKEQKRANTQKDMQARSVYQKYYHSPFFYLNTACVHYASAYPVLVTVLLWHAQVVHTILGNIKLKCQLSDQIHVSAFLYSCHYLGDVSLKISDANRLCPNVYWLLEESNWAESQHKKRNKHSTYAHVFQSSPPGGRTYFTQQHWSSMRMLTPLPIWKINSHKEIQFPTPILYTCYWKDFISFSTWRNWAAAVWCLTNGTTEEWIKAEGSMP